MFACEEVVVASDETCDGVDEDCDGEVDEGVAECDAGPTPGPMAERPAWSYVPGDPPGMVLRTEVTQIQWRGVMGDERQPDFAGCDACPMEKVSWFDAVAFVNALSASEGRTPCYVEDDAAADGWAWPEGAACEGYRLPDGAEWEVAARAGSAGDYHNGRSHRSNNCDQALEDLGALGWFNCNAGGRTRPAAKKLPNAWGLYDVHGNVWEWTWDRSGANRVVRGGAWSYDANYARFGSRNFGTPSTRSVSLGFRPRGLALDP